MNDFLKLPSWINACSWKAQFHKQSTIRKSKPARMETMKKEVWKEKIPSEDEITAKAKHFNPVFD